MKWPFIVLYRTVVRCRCHICEMRKWCAAYVVCPVEKMEGEEVLNRFEYIVESIDGDYAHLRRVDAAVQDSDEGKELKLVARALLPPEITEGTTLLYEWMQYSVME